MNSEYYLYDRHTCKLRLSIVWTIHQSKAEIEFESLNPGQIQTKYKYKYIFLYEHVWNQIWILVK